MRTILQGTLSLLYFSAFLAALMVLLYGPAIYLLIRDAAYISIQIDPAGRLRGAAVGYGMSIAYGTIAAVIVFAVLGFVVWIAVNLFWPPRTKIISWPAFLTATIAYSLIALAVVPAARFWPHLYEQENFVRIVLYSLLMLAAGPGLYLVAFTARRLPRPLLE